MKKFEEIAKERAQERIKIDNLKHTGFFKKLVKIVFITSISIGIAVGIAATVVYLYFFDKVSMVPKVEQYKPSLTTKIYADNLEVIGEYSTEFREIIPYEKIPKKVIQAFIASEDIEFFDHSGLNYIGIIRAAWKNLKAGRVVQGGSSITQQTAKSFLGDDEKKERSFNRKIKEVIMSRQMEQIHSKEHILFLYLNQIYLGHGAYGVQEAAKHYFNKNIWELDLAEISLIAGLPQAPSVYSSYSNTSEALKRREYVLKRMLQEKFITKEEMDEALSRKIVVFKDIPSRVHYYANLKEKYPNAVFVYDYGVRTDTLSGEKNLLLDSTFSKAPYFSEYARRVVQKELGENQFYTGGYKIYTTVSLEKQHFARDAIESGLSDLSSRQGFYGAITNLKKIEYKKFLENSQKYYLESKPAKGRRYLALVTKVDKTEADVKFGSFEGKILIKNTKWARKENPMVYFGSALIGDLREPLSEGDVVWIRIYDKEELDSSGKLIVGLSQIPKPQGAILSVDYNSGYVKAMVGGRDYSDFNRALQAERQSGSIFKPLYYSKALDEDYTLSTTLFDSPIVEYDYLTKVNWKPANYENSYKGEVTLRTALMNSMNIPSIKVFQHLGTDKVANWVKKLGITSQLNMDSSMALGSTAIKLVDILTAFSYFANYGVKVPLVFIKKIEDRDGNILVDNSHYDDPFLSPESLPDRVEEELFTKKERVIDPVTSYLTLRLLRAVVLSGTAVAANSLKIPIAGKTGTTNDSFDTWFMGFSTSLLTGVWIGYDMNNNPLGRGEAGGRTSLPVWINYSKKALSYEIKNNLEKEFPEVDNLEWVTVDRNSGKKASPSSTVRIKEAFRAGTAPKDFEPDANVMDPEDILMGGN
ncbi:PBP1A family penicillin-binding protein [bacterium]|nr:PBP1A family penicillin-binding protein [bacterium]